MSIETAQSGLDCSVLSTLEGKTIILGVLDLNDLTPETPDQVPARARKALAYVPAGRLVLAPDCGMKYLPRDAFGKLPASGPPCCVKFGGRSPAAELCCGRRRE